MTSKNFTRLVEIFRKNMCLIACIPPSPKSHLYWVSPLLLWSSFSKLSRVLSPRRQSSFCPKENLTGNPHIVDFFFKYAYIGFPGGSEVKASARNAGDPDSIPGSGRSPGEGSGNPLQYSCLENSTDGGAWWAIVHGVAKSWTRLSDLHFHFHLHRSVQQFT